MSFLARLVEAIFAPVIELLGDLPPRALTRLFTPY